MSKIALSAEYLTKVYSKNNNSNKSILALNKLWGLNLSDEELLELHNKEMLIRNN